MAWFISLGFSAQTKNAGCNFLVIHIHMALGFPYLGNTACYWLRILVKLEKKPLVVLVAC